jgi:hypothetical protein
MFLQRTSSTTIALWTANESLDFPVPIVLSTGTGTEKFFNIDTPPVNVIRKQSLNGKIINYTRPVLVSGSVTLHPQSNALVSLRKVLKSQETNRTIVPGTALVINLSTLIVTVYPNFAWNAPYSTSNRNKTMEDVSLTYTCSPPNEVAYSLIESSITSILGFVG